MSSQKKIRSQGAYVIKAAESRPPRQSTGVARTAGRTSAAPNRVNRQVARALRQHKQR